MSLLPRSAPSFEGFDIWGTTRPAEEVGGDLYDFIPVSPRMLGIAVADSAGHGLPAALQARDAIIGLRMGVEERLRITATIEKLNKVVSHSALASKFISLFYGEIEKNGTLVYVNAGHAPPLLRGRAGLEELTLGGLVLGPNPDALYERGYVTLEAGDALLAYTDGISEAENPRGEAYGVDRLRELLRGPSWRSARDLVETLMGDVTSFTGSDLRMDDQTVVAVLRRR
jgi:sigma-B regulation protein RsbU (phosphoserine phosphatase)